MVLTAGRKKLSMNDDRQRGEEVAIVLLGPAIDVRKRAGKQWKAWDPSAVSCLPVGEGTNTKWDVVSCYAPTGAASRQEQDAFFQDL